VRVPEGARAWLVTSQALPARLIRFGAVGGATSLGYALGVAGLVEWAGAAPTLAAALAYGALLPLNYLGHRRATWRSRAPRRPEVLRFLAVHGVTALVCTALMAVATGPLGLSHWAGSLVIVITAPVLNFAMFDRWAFRG
jgi:putative flippase GtrA